MAVCELPTYVIHIMAEQVLLDPGGEGLVRLPGGMQRLTWPRDCREWDTYVRTWGLDPSVAAAALILGEWSTRVLAVDLWIISGGRSCAEQERLPGAAPCASSCHTTCPALAFDVGFDFSPSYQQRRILGQRAAELGLRAGIFFAAPPSPNHFDAGPC